MSTRYSPSSQGPQYDHTHAPASGTHPMSATGKRGDLLQRVIIVPTTTAAGTVDIKDGTATAIRVLNTGTLADLKPIVVELGLESKTGGWSIITGAAVAVIGVGYFS